MQTQTDDSLMASIPERDARSFETLFDRYAEPLYRYACSMLRDPAAASDVVQETFLRVWLRAEQWDGRGAPKAWLYRITTNLALNALRAELRRRELPLDPQPDPDDDDENSVYVPSWMVDRSTPQPEIAAELSEQRAFYRRAMARLPDEKRQVFHMVHDLEMSLRDAADALHIPEGTAKSRLYYARRALQDQYEDQYRGGTDVSQREHTLA